MSSYSASTDAAEKLRWMISKEMRGPGDGGPALHRLLRRYGIDPAAAKSILYRKPSDIYVSVYTSILAAFEAEVARWERTFEHERAIARAKTGVGAALLRLADKLDGVADQIGGPQDRALSDESSPDE